MLARVSHIESFRQWREDEGASVDDLVRRLTSHSPSEAMLAGTAFHAAIERAQYGTHDTLYANGYTFHLPDAELVLPAVRELRGYRSYGPLIVTGCVDAHAGTRIDDQKTTGRFDPERYLTGCAWRFYLDIFGADLFRWNVFEIDEVKSKVYQVREPHTLTAYRYPGMHEECARLAADFYEFARVHLPNGPEVNV